ncbi:MAG: type II toxin-antitoxin system HicB family antitoxin [Dehalococcoidia bacterium]|nr:type II toxin-antitoxin system HicB family antitoxin [Dehalococcoidia bacterium]
MTTATKFLVIDDGVTYEFEAADEGGYVVSVPDAPECWSEGDSFEEALANIKDALEGWQLVRERIAKAGPG